MIIDAIMCASVKISVESMISVYENRVDGNRNLDDESAAHEFIIAYTMVQNWPIVMTLNPHSSPLHCGLVSPVITADWRERNKNQ